MKLDRLYAVIDAKPFRPFFLSLTGGERIEVTHPDNIFVLPARHRVHHIEVYDSDTWKFAIIYPEAISALLFNGKEADTSEG